MKESVTIAAAEIRPNWLNKTRTVDQAVDSIESASADGVRLLVIPEAFVSGYPFGVGRTDGASFDSSLQEVAYSQFLRASVESDSPEVGRLVEAARDCKVAVQIGVNERGRTIGRGTVYCPHCQP